MTFLQQLLAKIKPMESGAEALGALAVAIEAEVKSADNPAQKAIESLMLVAQEAPVLFAAVAANTPNQTPADVATLAAHPAAQEPATS